MFDKIAKFVVYLLVAEDVALAVAYLGARRYAHALYWAAASVVCLATLFMGGK